MRKNILYLLSVACLLLCMSGCVAQRNLATVRNSVEAEKLFFNGQVAPKYNYYYYGLEHKPIALLALSKDFSVHSQFWTKIDLTDAKLQSWVDLFEENTYRTGDDYRGKEIVSPHSETIGLVLSRYHWVTAWFEDTDSSVVTIPPPDLTQTQPSRFRPNRANER